MKNTISRKPDPTPIENHQTAAWANISKTKPVSNVPIPDDISVDRAKDWVDENEK